MFIELKDIVYKYPSTDAPLFQDLNCRIEGPGFHALFGPSGVGKTTLARLLAGLEAVDGGRIVTDAPRILYTYNTERLPGWADVGEHHARVTPDGRGDRRAELTEIFGLTNHLSSRFSRLSMGQRNRANLTRYLVQDFDVLVMDESLANVDEATRERIILSVKSLFPRKLFLYISHNVMEVAKFCGDVVVLRGARKSPRIVRIKGRDHREGRPTDREALERTMLEIVNAA